MRRRGRLLDRRSHDRDRRLLCVFGDRQWRYIRIRGQRKPGNPTSRRAHSYCMPAAVLVQRPILGRHADHPGSERGSNHARPAICEFRGGGGSPLPAAHGRRRPRGWCRPQVGQPLIAVIEGVFELKHANGGAIPRGKNGFRLRLHHRQLSTAVAQHRDLLPTRRVQVGSRRIVSVQCASFPRFGDYAGDDGHRGSASSPVGPIRPEHPEARVELAARPARRLRCR